MISTYHNRFGYPTADDSNQAPEKRLTTVHTKPLSIAQGNYADAEPLYRRSLDIREKVLGPDHRDVAFSLDGLAALLDSQVITSFVNKFTEEHYSGMVAGPCPGPSWMNLWITREETLCPKHFLEFRKVAILMAMLLFRRPDGTCDEDDDR